MPIEPEPPPFQLCVASVRKSIVDILAKNTCALYDTGADDNTTDNPFIIHNLHLLPRTQWTRLHDAGQREHLSKYGGFAYLKHENGCLLKRFMRFTPSMGITVVDQFKLRDNSRKLISEYLVLDCKKKIYKHICSYER